MECSKEKLAEVSENKRKIIVAITGASGSLYAKRLIEELCRNGRVIVSVIISDMGRTVYKIEVGEEINFHLPDGVKLYQEKDFSAPFISGSSLFDAMIIVPCSMATLASIAHGTGTNIIHRTADVCLKEGRKLVLVPRETPLNVVHIENMLICARAGAVVMPAMPGFYHLPKTIDDIVNFMVSRILDHLEIPHNLAKRWQQEP